MVKQVSEFLLDGLIIIAMFFTLFTAFYYALDWVFGMFEVLYG